MPENRNKLPTVFATFFAYIQELRGQAGGGSTKAIQKVAEGEAGLGAHPIPYLLVQMVKAKPKARADQDLIWECQIRIRVISQAVSADGATIELLTKLAMVQDKIQTWTLPTGVTGFDQNEWSFSFPIDPTGPAHTQADSLYYFTVAVAHGEN